MKYKLADVCNFVKERTTEFDESNYVSTENMLPDKGGITAPSNMPDGSVVAYSVGDVLVSNIRPYFRKIWFADRNGGCSADVLVFRAKENCDKLFLRYALSSDNFFDYATSTSKGTKMPRGDKVAIMDYDIGDLPPLPTQRTIAATLSCLDDKIELNNRINANLEAQAQAVFKSWFVDFEPFRDGRFVDSKLGRIPKGWRVGALSDLGTIIGGATPSKKKSDYFILSGNGISWITPKDLSINKDKFISHGEIDITDEGYKNCSAKLMPKGTVLFSSRAPIGYLAIASKEVCTNQGFKSIIPNNDIGTAYVYYYLKTNIDTIESHASGSTFKEISGNVMKNIAAIIPDKNTLSKFNTICDQIFKLQERNESQSRALAVIRDSLLPKLMSGEVEVEENER
jgi:type I restriction enzyme S subunit